MVCGCFSYIAQEWNRMNVLNDVKIILGKVILKKGTFALDITVDLKPVDIIYLKAKLDFNRNICAVDICYSTNFDVILTTRKKESLLFCTCPLKTRKNVI